ncbi:MAG: helix-turn-helix domain-containing protein [Cellvibrionaceae bacterium]|nr:helix-turn-helix domain-containing protein [Cellvibrionaceae bacterium]
MTDDSPLNESSAQEFDPGRRLRQLRLELGLSQRELSRRAGMTNANLSMIEQGRVSPSLQTLERILRAIPISLEDFFRADAAISPSVFAAAEQIRITQPGVELFVATASGFEGQPTVVRGLLKPSASISDSPAFPKNSWLSGVVAQGYLTLVLEETKWTLGAGDAFQFHRNRSFHLENQHNQDLHLTLVVSSGAQVVDIKV